jgi:hypothetical protein
VACVLMAAGEAATAEDVPLPRPRPATLSERFGNPAAPAAETLSLAPPELQGLPAPEDMLGPTACEKRLAEVAAFTPLPKLMGPGACGGGDMVRLEGVLTEENGKVALTPPAVLRCSMAEQVALWMRQDVAPAALELGARLAAIANFDSYDCRGRNRVAGAKLSEHGRGNAIDIRSIRLANGAVLELTATGVSKDFRERLRTTACARFTTVLGPGSDGYHEGHVHFDLAERTRGYRMCQWDVRTPAPVAAVPLPPPRPATLADADAKVD